MAAYEFRSMLGSTPAAICRNRIVRLLKTCWTWSTIQRCAAAGR